MLQRLRQIIGMRLGNKTGNNARRSLWTDVRALIRTEHPVIIDGGSNQGELVDLLLNQYQHPRIYAIEANPDLAGRLREKFSQDDRVTVIPKALGSFNGVSDFHIAGNLYSSSVFARGVFNERYHGTLTAFIKTISVPMVRLEKLVASEESIAVLKLDLEGSELAALQGARALLPKIKVIVTEVEFVDEYAGAPRFSELEMFLREHNFRLFNFYDCHTYPDGQLTTGDALFINNAHFP
ncbi:MAG: FkbM family methyltransferase [Candidatus Doudnabacteria bacterium]|nr:FkbM family methyltransferase [Candidatus Doudnabacteria bacterium]